MDGWDEMDWGGGWESREEGVINDATSSFASTGLRNLLGGFPFFFPLFFSLFIFSVFFFSFTEC
jgi:hypothetical protein